MEQRSLRAEVRNPVLALPSAVKLKALSPEARAALAKASQPADTRGNSEPLLGNGRNDDPI